MAGVLGGGGEAGGTPNHSYGSGGSGAGAASAAMKKKIATPKSGVYQVTVPTPVGGGLVKAPAVKLQAGMVVDVYPLSTNTNVVFSGLGPTEAQYGPNVGHAMNSNPVTYHVANLGDIWIYSATQQGALLVVRPL